MPQNKYYSSSRSDPIQLLRNAVTNKKKIKLHSSNAYLVFDKDMKVPINTPTAWLSQSTKKQYNLGSLWAFLQYGSNSAEYTMKLAEIDDVEKVIITDQSEISNYFTGKISDSNCINNQLKMQLLLAAKSNGKRDQPAGGFNNQQIAGEGDLTNINRDKKKDSASQLPFELKVIDYIARFERPTGSKTRSLRCPNKSFEFFLNLLKQGTEKTTTVSQGRSRLSRIFEKKKYPIIIVPESVQAGNLHLSNIEQFLLQGEYTQPQQVQNYLQRKIQIETILRGKKVIFQVTNNPTLLSLAQWENVCAVFTLGNKSEFSSWKIRDPLQIFKKTKGFLLRYSTISKQDANDWNVKTFIMERNTRYRDSEVQKKIWSEIEDFLFEKVISAGIE